MRNCRGQNVLPPFRFLLMNVKMKTKKQLEEEFRKDFQTLLEKHNAEIEITDDDKPYGMHSAIVVITIPNKYDNDNNLLGINFSGVFSDKSNPKDSRSDPKYLEDIL